MTPNEVFAFAFWVILGLIVWAGVHLANIYYDGVLDAKFPDQVSGDWRTGWRRKIYIAGRASHEGKQHLVNERKGGTK